MSASVLVVFAGCNDGAAGWTAPADERDVMGLSISLSEDRTVRVGGWDWSAGTEMAAEELDANTIAKRLISLCTPFVRESEWASDEGNGRWVGACQGTLGYTQGEGTEFVGTDAAGFVHLCAGHFAMQIASAVSPLYMGTDAAGRPRLSPARSEFGGGLLGWVPTPSASDAASWALLATDFFRTATMHHGTALGTCGAPLGTRFDGVQYAATLSANLADALSASVDAAALAQKHLHASALARHATGADLSAAQSAAWRDPYDSLLRAASPFAPIPAALYNQVERGRVTKEGDFPAVTKISVNQGDHQAEVLLRAHHIDPQTSAGPAERTVGDVADDLVRAIDLSLGGALGDVDGLAYLATVGIDREDLDRAAARLVQRARALGQPLTRYEQDGIRRVRGTERGLGPVNPWYLYASTGGSAHSLYAEQPTASYANLGIYHAMDYVLSAVRLTASGALGDVALDPDTQATLRTTLAFANQHVAGRVVVATRASAGALDLALVRVVAAGQAPLPAGASPQQVDAAVSALRDQYDVWLGEEGLACALSGTAPSGEPCVGAVREQYRFADESPGGVAWFDESRSHLRHPSFVLDSTHAPRGKSSFLQASSWPRVYITRASNAAGTPPLLVSGFTLLPHPNSQWNHFVVPISAAMVDGLYDALAVDPDQPEQTGLMCGKDGLPRDIKLGLEDELIASLAAQTGSRLSADNNIEESWAYYLSLARDAASRADELGSELVEKGLRMDARAEKARGVLEDLCGGVVNVGDLRERVCAPPHNCDLMSFLRDASIEDQKLQQLRKCLGIEPTRDAVLGSNAVCMWQVGDLPPCTCPDDLLASRSCPGRAATPFDQALAAQHGSADIPTRACPAPLPSNQVPSTATCERMFMPPLDPVSATGPNNTLFPEDVRFWAIAETLAIVPDLQPGAKPPKLACTQLAEARELSAKGARQSMFSQLGDRLGWTKGRLASVAARLGVARDSFNFVTIQRDGAPWLATDSLDYGRPWGGRTDFPCAPMGGVDCSGENPSILCSLDCDPRHSGGLSQLDTVRARARYGVGERLASAVELLRLLSGTGMQGIEVRTYNFGEFDGEDEAPDEPYIDGVEFRRWHRAIELDDCSGSRLCTDGKQDYLLTCLNRSETPAPEIIEQNPLDPLVIPQLTPLRCRDEGRSPIGFAFTDAGIYKNWPVVSPYDLDNYWAREIKDDLRAAWATGTVALQKRSYKDKLNDTFVGMRYLPALSNFSEYQLADALELACLASSDRYVVQDCESDLSIQVQSIDDLEGAKGMLTCRAESIRKAVATMPLRDVPTSMVKQLADAGVVSVYPEHGGKYADAVNELYGALLRVSTLLMNVASLADSAGKTLDATRNQLRASGYRQDEAAESAAKEIAAIHDACTLAQKKATVQLNVALANPVGAGAGGMLQALSAGGLADEKCSLGEARAGRARSIAKLAQSAIEQDKKEILIEAAERMVKHQESVQKLWNEVLGALGDSQAALAKLTSVRNQATRAAATLLMLDADSTGRVYELNTALRAQYNTAQIRYERARDLAVRMAFLARRAIEQKLGIDLSRLTDDVGWVRAPRTWADRICALSGIDYAAVRSASAQTQTDTAGKFDYAEEYVGDYVRKLEELMTAYVNTYVSHDGEDTVVISLRDEILESEQHDCDAEGHNLLRHSYGATNARELGASSGGEPTRRAPAWAFSCTESHCVEAVPETMSSDGAGHPLVPYGRNADGEVAVATLNANSALTQESLSSWIEATDAPNFGSLGNVVTPVRLRVVQRADATALPDGAVAESGLTYSQSLSLRSGTYLLSWFEPRSAQQTAALLPSVRDGSGEAISLSDTSEVVAPDERWLSPRWRRRWTVFEASGVTQVGWDVPSELAGVLLAAPQLERLDDQSRSPSPYWPTDGDGLVPVGRCPDQTGEGLRVAFESGCEVHCPSTLPECERGTTDTTSLPKRCYHQVVFDLDPEELTAQRSATGFAAGNFNHRWEHLAVNLVGNRVKNCEAASNRASCEANAFASFSLRHDGPFAVENWLGRSYEAPLFPGRVQQARALAVERYLQNPISGEDRVSLSDHWRRELIGRPLHGTYTLRIYDEDGLEDGVDWDAVEDVQLAIRYRFWTRLD